MTKIAEYLRLKRRLWIAMDSAAKDLMAASRRLRRLKRGSKHRPYVKGLCKRAARKFALAVREYTIASQARRRP